MASLLHAIPDRGLLIICLLVSSSCALRVITAPPPALSPRAVMLLLAPQQAFLFTTSIGAWLSVWWGMYADGVMRSSLFITADQLPRGMFCLIHLTAIYGLIVFHAYSSHFLNTGKH